MRFNAEIFGDESGEDTRPLVIVINQTAAPLHPPLNKIGLLLLKRAIESKLEIEIGTAGELNDCVSLAMVKHSDETPALSAMRKLLDDALLFSPAAEIFYLDGEKFTPYKSEAASVKGFNLDGLREMFEGSAARSVARMADALNKLKPGCLIPLIPPP
jgi:hypothetical protein